MPEFGVTFLAFRMPDKDASQPARGPGLASGLLAWVAGTALQLQQEALYPLSQYAAVGVVLAVSLWVWLRWFPWRTGVVGGLMLEAVRWAVPLVSLVALAFCTTGLRAAWFAGHSLAPRLEGRDLWVTGVVRDMPQRNLTGLRVRLDVEHAALDGVPVTLPALLDVAWYGGPLVQDTGDIGLQRAVPDIRAGERWQWLLRPKAPHGARNPHGFDYELHLWEQGVQGTAYVRAGPKDPVPRMMAQTWQHPMALARQGVRDRLLASVQDPQRAGVLAALAVGDQAAVDRADWNLFRATGVSHLLSISGLHITLLGWLAGVTMGWAWRRSARLCLALPAPTAAAWTAVVVAVSYAVFSGWGVPAQRTSAMMLTVFALRLVGARWPWPVVWLLACAVVVALDPWALLQPGFWLSFVAVGVLFASGPAGGTEGPFAAATEPVPEPALETGRARRLLMGLTRRLRHMLREQWIVTLALAPLSLMLFGQLSLVGLVANLWAVPWVTLVITPLSMLGAVVPALWDVGAWAVALMLGVLQWMASLPLASWSWAVRPWWLSAAAAAGACMLVLPWPWHMRVLGAAWITPALLWTAPLLPQGEFSVLAMDIGQGNAVLVRTAGHALLYDAGPRYSLESDAGHRVVVPLLQSLQLKLDALVLSHRDTDHVGGAEAVLAMQPGVRLLSSLEAAHPLLLERQNQRCEAGLHWNWDGVQFDVLYPPTFVYDTNARPNAHSCVLRISNAVHSALLVADIESPQEASLVADAEAGRVQIRADALLVPHHGSKTSSTGAFLDAVQPTVALVQSGYRNRFGHPAPVVMDRYVERKVIVRTSPQCGAMTWSSEAPGQVLCEREMRAHYWSHPLP